MRTRKIDDGVQLRGKGRGHDRQLAAGALQLHQDRREALCEVVMDVARETIALLENRLAPLLDAAPLDDAAVMQRERRLPGDGLEQLDAPPLALLLIAGAR